MENRLETFLAISFLTIEDHQEDFCVWKAIRGSSSAYRRPAGGLLCIEDLQEVFCNRRPSGSLLSIKDLQEVFSRKDRQNDFYPQKYIFRLQKPPGRFLFIEDRRDVNCQNIVWQLRKSFVHRRASGGLLSMKYLQDVFCLWNTIRISSGHRRRSSEGLLSMEDQLLYTGDFQGIVEGSSVYRR